MNQKEALNNCENHYSLIKRNYLMGESEVKVIKVEPTSTSIVDTFEATVICEWLDPKDNNLKIKNYGLDTFLKEAKACK